MATAASGASSLEQRLSDLQLRVDVQRDLIGGHLLSHRLRRSALASACPDSHELRSLSSQVRALSVSVAGNRARLEALRDQTAAVGALALEVTLLASGTTRALASARAVHPGSTSALGRGSARPLALRAEAAQGAAPSRDQSSQLLADLARARARLQRLGVHGTQPFVLDVGPAPARWTEGSAGLRIFERLRDAMAELELPVAELPMPRALLELRLPSSPLAKLLDDCCAICLAPIRLGEQVVPLSCSHTFHGGCIREACAHRSACPICRRPVPWR